MTDRVKQILYLDFPREEPLIVRDLSWLVDSILFGYNRPFGYHYGNVIYHSLTVVLAFLLLLRLTSFNTALISAVLLLALAAHIEPVAWIMGRKDILSTLFSLGCILLFLKFRAGQSQNSRLLLYTASLVLAGAAYLSKTNAVVLPGILFICALIDTEQIVRDGFSFRQFGGIVRTLFLQVLPFFVIGLGVYLWYKSVLADYGLFDGTLKYSYGDYKRLIFVTNPLIFIEYLKIILVPWDLEAYYTAPSLFTKFSGVQITQAVLVYLFAPAAMVLLWRFNRTSCLLFLCFLVAMLPYGNWIHFGFWYANRYVYFSSIFFVAGLSSLVVGLSTQSAPRFVKMTAILALAWIFAHNMVYRSQYLGVWRNGETLWQHEISIAGASIHDYNNLTANYLGEAEDSSPGNRAIWLEKARAVNEEVFALDVPRHEQSWLPVAYYYKGLILAYSNAPLEAQLQAFLQAVDSSTGFSRALRSTGVIYYQLATRETNPERRKELAKTALDYMRMYFESDENSQRARREQRDMLQRLNREFPDLAIPEIETEKHSIQ